MIKKQFLEELKKQLKKLPKQDQEEIIRDYDEYFQIAQLEGKQEHEVAQSLGTPKQLAKELIATYYIEEMQKSASFKNITQAVWAAVGSGFLNIVFILGPFIAIVATLAALWITASIFVVTPLVVLLNAAINIQLFTWFEFFVALTISGVGILLLIGLYYITALFKKWTIHYLKFNVSIVKGETVNA